MNRYGGKAQLLPRPRPLALLIAVLLMAQVGAVSAESRRPSWCRPSGNLQAEEMPQRAREADCPMQGRVIEDHGGASTAVPLAGTGVFAEVILLDGSMQVLRVVTEADGTVVLDKVGDDMHQESASHEGSGEMGLASHASSPSACSDPANSAYNWRDTNQFTWYFRSSTTPSNLTIANAANDLLAGYNAIINSHNDCGLTDQVTASQLYGGNTTSGGNFDSSGNCQTSGDGIYVADFGYVGSALGKMCHWQVWDSSKGFYEVSSADIKLSSGHSWFTGSVPASCSNRWSVRTIMAHEAGHVFGMDHVPWTTNGYLTMANSGHSCSDYQYTLGKGDVDLLRQLY